MNDILSFLSTAFSKCEAYELSTHEIPKWGTREDEAEGFKAWLRNVLKQPIDIRTYEEDFKEIVMTLGIHADREITWKDVQPDCPEYKANIPYPKENRTMFKSGEDLCDELYVYGSFIIKPLTVVERYTLPKKRPRDEDE